MPTHLLQEDLEPINTQLAQIETEGIQLGTGTKYGYFSISKSREALDWHGFEDWGQLNPDPATQTNQGYSAFDAKPTMTNTNDQNHLVGYQARQVYNGSGNLTNYMHGFNSKMVHSGTGNVQEAAGLEIDDVYVTNGGTITDNYGILIKNIKNGTSKNYGVYSLADKNYFKGLDADNVRAVRLDFPADSSGKVMTLGYGGGTAANFGTINIYNGKDGRVAYIDQNGLTLLQGLTLSKPLTPKKYTYASLPVGTEGDIAYCTNGRKMGEGAGAGTGVPIYYSSGWRRYSDDTIVTA